MTKPFQILVAVCSFLSTLPALGQDVTLKVSTERSEYTLGEPVVLRCVFLNESNEDALVNLGRNDAEDVSFLLRGRLRPDSGDAVKLRYRTRRGGGDFGTHETLAPHQDLTRYIVLDQWYRPTEPGVYRLEFQVTIGRREISAPFEVRVGAADGAQTKAGVEAMIVKFKKLRENRDRSRFWEYRSCQAALELCFSYLADGSGKILDELKKEHEGDTSLRMLIESGANMGPGGRNILD